MGAVIPFFKDAAFEPRDIQAMSMALTDVCNEFKINADNVSAREIIAVRIISLAQQGERSPTKLRDRLLTQASGGTAYSFRCPRGVSSRRSRYARQFSYFSMHRHNGYRH